MGQYDDLISEFGSKGTTGNPVVTPHADLIEEFGSGSIKAQAPAAQDINIPSPENFERSKQIEAETAKKNAEFSMDKVYKLPIVRHAIKGFTEGKQLASQGAIDFTKGKPFTGTGEFVLGTTQQILNAIPVLPTIEAATEQVGKITGNPDFAKRAELVATSGLPIAKVGKVVTEVMPSTRAVKAIVDAVGPENIQARLDAMRSNPRLSLIDVDPNVQVINQGLAAKPGEPRNILDKFVKGRNDTKLDAVTGAIDEAMGTPVNVLQKVEGLKKQIKDTGKEINPIVANSKSVDISPVIANIDAKLKPGVNSVITMGEPLPLGDIEKSLQGVRKLLTDDKSVRTDAKSLHAFQSALRAKADDLLASASGQDRQLGHALMNVRTQIVDAIDKASPQVINAAGEMVGTYKPALAKYRDINDVEGSFKKGKEITKNRSGYLEDDPSYWEKWVKEATPAELEAAREGARLAYRQQMGSITNAARKGMDIPLVEFNKEKLKLLFGKEEVEKMSKALADERTIADTNNKLMQGSMTAMRYLGAEATKVRPDYEPKFTKTMLPLALEAGNYMTGSGAYGLGTAVGIVYPFARGKITKIGQNLDRKTNVEIANLASSVGEARENLIKALQQHIPQGKLSMSQKLKLSLPVQKP